MAARNQPLQVLIAEDSENDALLLELELQRAGYDPKCSRVDTPGAMTEALKAQEWDLVIADYVMPHFNGLAALALVKQLGLDLPFIIVSGHITDDTAVAAMKAGAHDYVMKDNLKRLGPAVRRELREAELRQEQSRAQQRLSAEHAITRILAGAGPFEDAIPGILQVLLEHLDLEVAALWLREGQERVLRARAVQIQNPSPTLETFLKEHKDSVVKAGTGLSGIAWRERRVVWVTDESETPEICRPEPAVAAGLRTAMAFPMESSAGLLGVLEFFATRRVDYDTGLANAISAIGSEIGQFMQRLIAEEALRRAHDELELRVQQRTGELRTANAKLHESIFERKRLEHELLEITEKERRRIGLDLHDDLGQKLSGIALMTKGLELKLAKQNVTGADEAGKIHSLIQQAMTHASDLARDMATLDLKDNDLAAALAQLADHTTELFGINCRFKSEGMIPALEPHAATQLYKITQEAVTNAIKHGKAKKVSINLSNGSDHLLLSVQNDGLPFPDLKSKATGMGLRIMNYRASLLGAALEVKGLGTRGTLLTCSIPLEPKK
jgi:signal transduction histidine kinase/FixJ family two-component response regulator